MSEYNVSEKQLVDYLIHKQQVLKSELKKVELALEALKIDLNDVISNSNEKSEGAIDRLTISATKERLQPVKEFHQHGRLDHKIAFALSEKNDLTKEEILGVIVKNQPELDRNKFEKSLAVRLSLLLKNNMINGNKNGRNYTYRLIKQESIPTQE